MISSIVSRLVILLFGTLYPAYASYKAVRTKDVREYVKWMMYWIVFALFTCAETFTDVLFSFWFPFYYELKIIVVLWLLSPATKGSSILYRKFVHPTLTKKEREIDEAIKQAKAQGYTTILNLGARSVDYAKYFIMQTAIKGLQTSAPSTMQSFFPEHSSRTVVDGRPVANGFEVQHHNGHLKPSSSLEPLDIFQYSDDDEDIDYVPPPQAVVKEETEEPEHDISEDEKIHVRPKRRSARSRKQVKTVQIDDHDLDD